MDSNALWPNECWCPLVRAMRQILRGLDGDTFYMDDIIIFSNTWEEHKETVREVLQRFSEHNIILRPSKCSFGENKIEFIGHVIENGTIKPNGSKNDSNANAKHPETKKEVQSFLGLTGYYRNYIV